MLSNKPILLVTDNTKENMGTSCVWTRKKNLDPESHFKVKYEEGEVDLLEPKMNDYLRRYRQIDSSLFYFMFLYYV